MYQIIRSGEQVPEQPVGAVSFDRVEFLRCLRIEEGVERFAPVAPARAVLDETKVPFHLDAARRYFSTTERSTRQSLTA